MLKLFLQLSLRNFRTSVLWHSDSEHAFCHPCENLAKFGWVVRLKTSQPIHEQHLGWTSNFSCKFLSVLDAFQLFPVPAHWLERACAAPTEQWNWFLCGAEQDVLHFLSTLSLSGSSSLSAHPAGFEAVGRRKNQGLRGFECRE